MQLSVFSFTASQTLYLDLSRRARLPLAERRHGSCDATDSRQLVFVMATESISPSALPIRGSTSPRLFRSVASGLDVPTCEEDSEG